MSVAGPGRGAKRGILFSVESEKDGHRKRALRFLASQIWFHHSFEVISTVREVVDRVKQETVADCEIMVRISMRYADICDGTTFVYVNTMSIIIQYVSLKIWNLIQELLASSYCIVFPDSSSSDLLLRLIRIA